MRTFTPAWLRFTAVLVAAVMGLCAIAPPVHGALAPSQPVTLADIRAADLAKAQQILEQKVVQQRLEALGFTQIEIQQRLARASDADLHQFALQSDQLIAGSDDIGLIVGLLLIVLLVLLILHVADRKVIVT